MSHTALVTGANRGIGLEVCRELVRHGLSVVLSGRKTSAVAAAQELAAAGMPVTSEVLDVADPASITACASRLANRGVAVDVLVNNAAVYADGDLLGGREEDMREAIQVNYFGPYLLCRAFVPAMLERGYGRVVNVSSGLGQFSNGLTGPAAYSLSKAALNALTVRLAGETHGNVKVNAVCPGWVRTRMGGEAAPRTVEQGADTVVWLATLPANGPNGGLFRDRRPIPW
ncbi:MAG: SDR family NAD(P)-dependent oxidoreductase [Nitrospirota bacterium]|nr:SDR family NAD(P)-dependent oxidoreductase [Nitrospirota bacterium]